MDGTLVVDVQVEITDIYITLPLRVHSVLILAGFGRACSFGFCITFSTAFGIRSFVALGAFLSGFSCA